MLVPLTRQKFEQLIPTIATSPQYKYYWGKFDDFLRRLLISVVAAVVCLVIRILLGIDLGSFVFVFGFFAALYWLWGPVFLASMRNIKCRRYKYSGFFQGRVLDYWISEELIGKQETVNERGDLVIVENREKRINLEIGDNSGFTAEIQAPLKVAYKGIAVGQIAEMIVMSNRTDLSQIEEISDVYIPSRSIWVSDYPYLQRNFFIEVGQRLRDDNQNRSRRPRRDEEYENEETERDTRNQRQKRRNRGDEYDY
jgi:hypothetical protein